MKKKARYVSPCIDIISCAPQEMLSASGDKTIPFTDPKTPEDEHLWANPDDEVL